MPDDGTQVLAERLGLAELPEDVRAELTEAFAEVALKAAAAAILEKLSEGKRAEFADLAEAGDAAKIQAFLDREVPGHEALAGAAVRAEFAAFSSAVTSPT
ncbi:MAG: hypothetical protein KGI78_03780 [Patescibacteria group bacterium]|nr:hypothetical protein [Patescibacteria group bacterium]MDE1944175.1 hypothetical protein [Patescibacteria group bacterium]MDE1945077.1 hypothetical protein [Patescibacteria group bacterium]MDE2057946.1 hypothetical protein [Patescibacteria group bacterium]